MTAPTVTVEIAFTSDFSTPEGSRAWTDVTAFVEAHAGLPVRYGRTDERTQAEANTITVTLDNRDGRFTPEKVTGAYHPNVKLYRPIRVTAQYPGGTARPRFTGYIRSWTPTWGGSDATAQVEVQAASRMQRLGVADELRSAIGEEILSDGPVDYWTMGDPTEATTASNTASGGVPLGIAGSPSLAAPVFGEATGLSTDGLTAVQFNAGRYLSASFAPVTFGTWEAFVLRNGIPTATETVLKLNSDSQRAIEIFAGTGQVVATVLSSTTNVCDGKWHHILVTTDATGSWLYVDGVLEDSSIPMGQPAAGVWIGGSPYFVDTPLQGACAHVALYTSTLTAADAAAHAGVGLTGFDGETTEARLDRLASWRGIPASEVDAIDTTRTVRHWDPTGSSLLDTMRILEQTESGTLHDTRSGHLRLVGTAGRYLATTAFTLDLAEQYVTVDLTPEFDDAQLLNDATVTNKADGTSARAVDTASVTANGRSAGTAETASTSPDATGSDAAWLLARYANPTTRLSSVTVTVHSLPAGALQEAVLAADINDLVTITNLPQQFASNTGQWFIEGYSESFGVGTHYVTLNLSAATPYLSTLVLDSATRGLLDTNTLAL